MATTEQPRHRYITTHDPETGKSIFDTSIPSHPVPQIEYPGGLVTLETSYASEGFPHNLCDNADLKSYQNYLSSPPGISIPGGTVVRFLDLKPGATSPLHRSITVDCGVIIDGEVKLELDSGETKILKKGDVVVQRATSHAWHNVSETETARMVFFIQPAQPLEVAGKTLVEQ